MKKKFCVLLLLIAAAGLALCACGLSHEEAQAVKELERNERDNFIAQAKEQYGGDAVVRDIYVPTVSVNQSVWPVLTTRSTGYLAGNITVGDEAFYGVYRPEERLIYSRRNYDKIEESVGDLLGITGLDLLDLTIETSFLSYDQCCLPDDVLTFQQLLETEDSVRAVIYTTSDISGLDRDYFSRLYQCYDSRETSGGHIVLLQLEDPSLLEALEHDIGNITFEYENSASTSRVYDSGAKDYVNAFEKYAIRISIYMAKDKFVMSERSV